MINGPHALTSALASLPVMSEIRHHPVRRELTDAEFMDQLRLELSMAADLSDEDIAAYTQDQPPWLAYKDDGYSPLEAVEADMEHWN